MAAYLWLDTAEPRCIQTYRVRRNPYYALIYSCSPNGVNGIGLTLYTRWWKGRLQTDIVISRPLNIVISERSKHSRDMVIPSISPTSGTATSTFVCMHFHIRHIHVAPGLRSTEQRTRHACVKQAFSGSEQQPHPHIDAGSNVDHLGLQRAC